MKILITYDNGAKSYFDSDKFTATEPFKSQGIAGMVEWQPRYDLLHRQEDPIFLLDIFWYDFKVTTDSYASLNELVGMKMYHAQRMPACRVLLAEAQEIEHIIQIEVDGCLVAWRQSGVLIDGVKFSNQEILCFSSQTTDSINKKAAQVYEYLHNADPLKSKEEIAEIMGYPVVALDYILSDEFLNSGFADDDPEAIAENMAVAYLDANRSSAAEDEALFAEDVDEDMIVE